MNEPKALLVADPYLQADRWAQMTTLAQSLVQSQALPKDVKNAHQALVKMQYGLEIGLKPMQALSGTMIINGAVNPWGKTVVYLLRQAGWRISYQEEINSCTATITKDDEEYSETMTFADAEKSKWTHQWKKNRDGQLVKDREGNFVKELKVGWYEGMNRRLKLRYGALSAIIKSYVPDVLGGAPDIVEVAEDYIIEETTPAPVTEPAVATTPRGGEQIITTTPDERKTGLAEFLENEQKRPKVTPITKKDITPAPKADKKAPKTSNSAQKGVKTENDQAIEGEVVAEGGGEAGPTMLIKTPPITVGAKE